MRAHENEHRISGDPLPVLVDLVDQIAGKTDAEPAVVASRPLRVGHLLAVAVDPADVAALGLADAFPLEPVAAVEDGLRAPELGEQADEIEEFAVGVAELPVEPGDLAVLAVGVVVPALRLPELV